MKIDIKKLIYEGKSKRVYETSESNKIIFEFKDDVTALNGKKHETLQNKGHYTCLISTKLFETLEKANIPTHYIGPLQPPYILNQKLTMIPLEVVCRNIATGSLTKRLPIQEKQEIDPPLIEFFLKNDEYGDPLLTQNHIKLLKIVDDHDLKEIRENTLKANNVLRNYLANRNILLVDAKFEFGYTNDGDLLLGDEISPDTCRFWDSETHETLDKDLFRKGRGGLVEAYSKVYKRLTS